LKIKTEISFERGSNPKSSPDEVFGTHRLEMSDAQRSSSTFEIGVEQQIRALPSEGGSSGSGE
jgi:hypothetical protein